MFLRTNAQPLYRSYGDPGVEEGGACLVPVPASSDLYLAGYRGEETLLMRLNQNGQVVWQRTFHFSRASFSDRIYDLRIDSDGMLIGCGRSNPGTGTAWEGFAFRYNPATNAVLWVNQSANISYYTAILEPVAGGDYVAVGHSRVNGTPDALRVELDRTTGAIATSGINEAYALLSAEDFVAAIAFGGDVYGTGRFSNSAATSDFRPAIAQMVTGTTGPAAEAQHLVNLTVNARLYPQDITTDNTDFFVFSNGDLTGTSTTVTTVQLYSTSSSVASSPAFTQLWGMDYDITNFSNENALELLLENNEMIAYGHELAGNGDLFLMSTDLSGNVNWIRSYGEAADDEQAPYNAQHQLIRHNGFLYFTGESNGTSGSGDRDIILYKTNLDGSMDLGCPTDTLSVDTMSPPTWTANVNSTRVGGVTLSVTTETPDTAQVPDSLICGSDCFAATDPAFTTPAFTVPANSYVTWSGKLYIPANTVITVQAGATLDMSNVDVVFEPCSGILFQGGSSIRANNSVFRTCDPSESWLGFNFEGDAEGQINECTFKNAERALAFESSGGAPIQIDVAVTNNLFSNNWWAIRGIEANLGEDISGNTFRVDASVIDYEPGCQLGTYSGLHFGINLANCIHSGKVTQNDFTYATQDQSKEFTGVFYFTSEGTISQNHFSNMWTAVEISNTQHVSVENNNIEITQGYTHNENQIRFTNSQWIYVTSNHLENSNETAQFNLTSGAIYGEGIQTCNIKDNLIEGFTNGIQVLDMVVCNISENVIQNANLVGIYAQDGIDSEIACNQIHMRNYSSVNTIGIEYIGTIANPVSNIRGNCISDTWTAILLFTAVPNSNIPHVISNYLYNYTGAGVSNDGFQGNIGNPGNTYQTAGRNSFFSNNVVNLTPDILTTVPLTEGGNFNVNIVGGPVTSLNPNLYSSLAYCALEAGTNQSEVLGDEICDRLLNNMNGTLAMVQNDRINWQEYFGGFPAAYQPVIAEGWMRQINREAPQGMEKLMDFVRNSEQLSDFDRMKIEFEHLLLQGDLQAAREVLGAINTVHSHQIDWKNLEMLKIDLRTSGRNWSQLNSNEQSQLAAFASGQGQVAKEAQDLLNLAKSGFFFDYELISEVKDLPNMKKTRVDHDFMTVFPNPAKEQIKVSYFLKDAQGGKIELFDLQGRMLQSTALQANGGEAVLNINELPAGIYILSVSNQEGRQFNEKVVKH